MTMAPATQRQTELQVSFTLNGRAVQASAQPLDSLVAVLRGQLDTFSARIGCDVGACGVCTVLVDGEPTRGCLFPAFAAEGRTVTTVEGLGDVNSLHPLQQAFDTHYASQCGYCTPGMILTASALLARTAAPSRAEIQAAIAGNLCRCTGYQPIIEAIAAVAGTGGR
jgi:aerobic-type carbon monoxide dehydrogenase small subunit (CoxS/CutS family)